MLLYRVSKNIAPSISKPSRQLADNRQVVNCLSVRMLQPKTRWSDSFFGNSCFYWESSILATFTYIYQHNLIPPTSYNYSCMSVRKNRGSQIIIFMWHLIDIQAFLYHSLADAEVTICKYKWLIISTNAFVLGCLKWLRGTVGGRKIGKNLQIWLPSKKENANICKIDFSVPCTFTLFNADFCTFLQSLWSEQGMNLLCPLVMLIVISNLLYSNGTGWHFIVPCKTNTLLSPVNLPSYLSLSLVK